MSLKKVYLEDQKDRNVLMSKGEFQLLRKKDKQRRQIVLKYISEKKNISAEDYYFAAFIFHHSETIADSKKAIRLSKKSMELGYEKAKWLYAASVDRLCMKEKKPQKYATQYFRKSAKSKYKLYKVDKKVKDSERLELGLPTLKQAIANEKNFNK